MHKFNTDIHPTVAETLNSQILKLRAKLDTASDSTGVVDIQAERIEICRTEWEDALDLMLFIISRASETPDEREAREIDAEQHRVYNSGLGI